VKSTLLTLLALGVLVFGASEANADEITVTESASSAAGFSDLGDFFNKR
jgi:hypothetical protein